MNCKYDPSRATPASSTATAELRGALGMLAVTDDYPPQQAWDEAIELVKVRSAAPQAQATEPEGWEHLKQYGYAPGDYMSRCSACGGTFAMDKRAITCKQCAETQHARSLAAPCDVPPAGWQCTRAKGHEGPCAAAPTAPQAVPLTDGEIGVASRHAISVPTISEAVAFRKGARFAEEFHGIGTTATKEQSND